MQMRQVCALNPIIYEDLSCLDAWLISNKLFLTVAKTESMLVSTKAKRKAVDKSNQNQRVKINGMELEVVGKIKYLGVLLTQQP